MEWYKLYPVQWYRQTRNMTPEEKGQYMDATVDAVTDGKAGRTELADNMLACAAEVSKKQSNRRKHKGGDGADAAADTYQPAPNHGEPRLTAVNHGEPRLTAVNHKRDRERERQTENPDTDPTRAHEPPRTREATAESGGDGKSESESGIGVKNLALKSESGRKQQPTVPEDGGGDIYAGIGATPDDQLPEFAVQYCGEPDNTKAICRYRAAILRMGENGAWHFRRALEAFMGDCRDHPPCNKGAAFNAIVTRLENAWDHEANNAKQAEVCND